LRYSSSEVNRNTLEKNRSTPHWVRQVAGEYLKLRFRKDIKKNAKKNI
jgi:hypothetical protein